MLASTSQPVLRQLLDERVLRVVLVADVADDLLDDVLQRDDAARAAELVHDDREVEATRLHLPQELANLVGLRDEEDRAPDDPIEGAVRLALPAVARASRRQRALQDAEEILRVEDALDLIDAVAIDGVAAVAALHDDVEHLVERGVDLDRLHLRPRHHHLARDGVLELQHAEEQLREVLGDRAALLALLDHVLDLAHGVVVNSTIARGRIVSIDCSEALAVPGVLEVSIGHALVGEALYEGFDATIRAYLRVLDAAR